MLAVLLASESDVDDLIPTLVAYQIEWNKLRRRMLAAGWPPDDGASPGACAAALGGAPDDWAQLADAWGEQCEAHWRRSPRRASRCACGCSAARRSAISA